MKTLPQFTFLKLIFIAVLFLCSHLSFALDSSTPVVSPDSSFLNKPNHTLDPDTTLVIHKPATDPAWGKVIQYQQEQAVSSTDKTRETLHKFLFQDASGVIRLATFHESASGGYWEVWVWDQP